MTLQTFGDTWLTVLPYDIQNIIFNQYTEMISKERFNEIIDTIPSELSNDVPNDNIFVDTFNSPPTLYEKLINQLMESLKQNAKLHNDMDLMQRDRRSPSGSTVKFITHLIIDFINISLLSIQKDEYGRFNDLNHAKNNLMKHVINENNLHIYNDQIGKNYNKYNEQDIVNALHILDYRELLHLKCISNSKVLFFNDNILKEYFVTYLKSNNCRRVIYDTTKNNIYYWINNHIGAPKCVYLNH